MEKSSTRNRKFEKIKEIALSNIDDEILRAYYKKGIKSMNKIYQKSELIFALIWIGIYIFSMSISDYFSKNIGIEKIISLPVSLILVVAIILWIKKNNFFEKYGLCKSEIKSKKMLCYLPLFLLVLINFIFGINFSINIVEMILFMATMLCIGLMEEVIFRGFLFKAISKDSLNLAIVVSSVTFGIGHIVNLINGSGMKLTSNLLQIIGAIVIGFLFTLIFCKTKSLWSCIITHGCVNAFSILGNTQMLTIREEITMSFCLIVIAVIYSYYIWNIEKETCK